MLTRRAETPELAAFRTSRPDLVARRRAALFTTHAPPDCPDNIFYLSMISGISGWEKARLGIGAAARQARGSHSAGLEGPALRHARRAADRRFAGRLAALVIVVL